MRLPITKVIMRLPTDKSGENGVRPSQFLGGGRENGVRPSQLRIRFCRPPLDMCCEGSDPPHLYML